MMERRRQAVGLMHAITTPGVNWLVLAEALGGPVGQAHERDAAGRIVARLGAELRLLKQDPLFELPTWDVALSQHCLCGAAWGRLTATASQPFSAGS